jgi:hypothetical protein
VGAASEVSRNTGTTGHKSTAVSDDPYSIQRASEAKEHRKKCCDAGFLYFGRPTEVQYEVHGLQDYPLALLCQKVDQP